MGKPMNIRQHVLRSINDGMPAHITVRDTVPGVQFDADDHDFIPFEDLGYSQALGYYRLSAFPDVASECDGANPETIHMLAGSTRDGGPMYVWMDADGDPHLLRELHRAADLYTALGALLLRGEHDAEEISEHDPAWGNNYDIAKAVEEAVAYGYGSDRQQVADSIRAAARAGRIDGAVQVDGKWSIPPRTLRAWLVRSREEKRGRPRSRE
jgi:hypothetical protein